MFYWPYAIPMLLVVGMALAKGGPLHKRYALVILGAWAVASAVILTDMVEFTPWPLFLVIDVIATVIILRSPSCITGAGLAVVYLWQIFMHIGFGFNGADVHTQIAYIYLLDATAYLQLAILGVSTMIGVSVENIFAYIRRGFRAFRGRAHREDSS